MVQFKTFQINYSQHITGFTVVTTGSLHSRPSKVSPSHPSIQFLNLLSCSGSQRSAAHPSMQWPVSGVHPTRVVNVPTRPIHNKHVIAVKLGLSDTFNASLMERHGKVNLRKLDGLQHWWRSQDVGRYCWSWNNMLMFSKLPNGHVLCHKNRHTHTPL